MPIRTNDTKFSGDGWKRREFLTKALVTLTGAALALSALLSVARVLTIQQVIDAILADIPGTPFSKNGQYDKIRRP